MSDENGNDFGARSFSGDLHNRLQTQLLRVVVSHLARGQPYVSNDGENETEMKVERRGTHSQEEEVVSGKSYA